MHRTTGITLLVIGLFLFSGCYHAKITTEYEPTNETIEIPWAHSFVYGIVPPKTVESSEECPHGVASVQTRISFLNGVVNVLTSGMYTPMDIKVNCAANPETDSENVVDNTIQP